MICKDCKAKKCPACDGNGGFATFRLDSDNLLQPDNGEMCDDCKGSGGISDHEACKQRNVGKVPADCDCQHRG